jgi:hypothetical protein
MRSYCKSGLQLCVDDNCHMFLSRLSEINYVSAVKCFLFSFSKMFNLYDIFYVLLLYKRTSFRTVYLSSTSGTV